MPSQLSEAPAHRYYYFAYGSNMCLKQMSERCPSSLLVGKGHLPEYKWQINERGVANIVESGRDFVDGLIFQIGFEDKKQLDRNEGVAQGFYKDESLGLELTALSGGSLKTFHVARELEEYDQLGCQSINQEKPQMINALVYISREYTAEGIIRKEYISRMEKAIVDARKLGLSNQFLRCVDRIVHQSDRLQESPETRDLLTEPSSKTREAISSQRFDFHGRINLDQPSHDLDGRVILIEPTPGYLYEPCTRTTYHRVKRSEPRTESRQRQERGRRLDDPAETRIIVRSPTKGGRYREYHYDRHRRSSM